MLIDTVDKLEAIKPSLLSCTDPTVDTETDGVHSFGINGASPNRIIGISIDDGREAYYFPFRHQQGANLPMECMSFFRDYLSNSDRTYGGFNYKFDQHMLYGDGVEFAPNYEDAMLAVHLLNENEPNFRLKDICDRYSIGDGSLQESILHDKVWETCTRLGIPISDAKGAPNNYKAMMGVLHASDVEPYACDDVRLTRGLLNMVKPALKHFGLYDIWKQINYYSYITGRMEQRGMLLDMGLMAKYQEEAEINYAAALGKLHNMAGYAINPSSSKQVCAFLGTESSAAEILDDVIGAGGDNALRAELVKLVRGWSSVDSRYYQVYKKWVDANNTLHCNMNMIGTISGRMSCTDPNLQAVAKQTDIFKVKDVFITRPGYTMVQADYKQAEMRLVTFYTKDPVMLKNIEDGVDLHSATAEQISIPRYAAKRMNFSVIYGIGSRTLSKNLRCNPSVARDYLSKYHDLYPGFRRLMGDCETEAEARGVIRLWTGRMRHFNVPQAESHKAMSNLIQGGVAEVVRVAISRLYPAICDLGGYMLLQVHDSVMFEIPDNILNTALPTIKMIMEDFDFRPAMGVDIEYGKSWGTMEKWEGGPVGVRETDSRS